MPEVDIIAFLSEAGEGDYSGELQGGTRETAANPPYPSAIEESYLIHFNRGDALFQLGRYGEAVREYARAIELEPNIQEMRKGVDLRKQRIRELSRSSMVGTLQ
ncbi:MAG: tetratricopeptide repeat protein [Acidobacteria bacterium]|nr:tetratricopeptide repeat protein [Acidobacteriota bacterium]